MYKFKNITLLTIISMMGLIFLAPQKVKNIEDIKKEETPKQTWIEGQRGWSENGTYLWTAVSPLPNYNVGIGTSTPSYKLDVAGNVRFQGSVYINSWPISVTSTPTTGYVLKWTGSAFTPQPDAGVGDCEWLDAGSYLYPRDQSAGDVRIYEDATNAKIYAYQTSSSYSAIYGMHSSGPYGHVGYPHSGILGYSNNTSGAGVFGNGGTITTGVYGQTNTSAEFGVWGVNTNASGSGVLGIGSNVGNILWSGQGDGVVGASDYYGVIGSHYNGSNNNRWGALGTPYNGVYGSSDNTSGAGVYGTGGTVTTGVYGITNTSAYFGVQGVNTNASGSGVLGIGSNVPWILLSGEGDGVVGASDYYGVVGSNFNGLNNNRWGALGTPYYGVYGSSDNTSGAGVMGVHTAASNAAVGVYGTCTGGTYDYTGVYGYAYPANYWGYGGYFVGGWRGVYAYSYSTGVYGEGGTYGVYSSGNFAASGIKSAIVKTSKGPRELYCVESPEIWFTEVGSGRLINGKAHIELDPLFLETVTIDENNPMKVIITLTDECNGVYVKKGKTGFDVIELAGGKSNATFDYVVYAKRKGYENKRLEYTEAGYLDEHLYPDPNDPEIPAKFREKRMRMEEGKKLGEKLHRNMLEAKTVQVSSPKTILSAQTVKLTPKKSVPPAEKGFKEELKTR